MSITHSTPADGSFTGAGKAAWDASHADSAIARSGDYGTLAIYSTALDALTETVGVHQFEVGRGTLGTGRVPISIKSADPAAANFDIQVSDTFVSAGQRNNVWSIGYNAAQETTEDVGAWYYTFESRWNDSGQNYMEHHLQGIYPHTSSSFRVATWQINRATGYTGHRIDFDDYSWVDRSGTYTMMSITGATSTSAIIAIAAGTTVSSADSASFTGNVSTAAVYSQVMISGDTGNINLKTSTNLLQLLVSHTANVSSYVQITGASGAGQPVISVQGGTDVTMALSAKGAGGFDFYTAGGSFTKQVQIVHTASANRTLILSGSNGGNPSISTSAGRLAITSPLTLGSIGAFVSADKYLIVDSSGNVHVSATGPAS